MNADIDCIRHVRQSIRPERVCTTSRPDDSQGDSRALVS